MDTAAWKQRPLSCHDVLIAPSPPPLRAPFHLSSPHTVRWTRRLLSSSEMNAKPVVLFVYIACDASERVGFPFTVQWLRHFLLSAPGGAVSYYRGEGTVMVRLVRDLLRPTESITPRDDCATTSVTVTLTRVLSRSKSSTC